MAGPLAGVRVLDLTTVVMGPYATQVLADFGADVVKVEPVEGDIMRHAAPMRSAGMGHIFLNANRNKRSIVLDLKRPEALAACLALAKDADVLVYNIRPQAMARLKLAYEDVRAVNPRIIYVGAFGYSQRGPYAAKAAYDDLIQGAAGLPWLQQAAGAEAPHFVPVIIADRSVGLHVVNAVCAALYRREKTGAGQRVDVPMFESLLQSVLGEHLVGHTFEPQLGEPGYARMLAKERRPYETRDGYICVLVYNDKQWKAFLELIGRPELVADPRFASQEGRSRNYDVAYGLMAEEMRKRGTEEWLTVLEGADIPVQRMNSLAEIFEDPHLAAIGYFRSVEHPSEGRLKSMAVPSEWSESPPEYRRHAPRLGEHTREVLGEAGYSEQAIDAMIAADAARSLLAVLREIQRVAQRSLDRRKRWFQDEFFDLYVWQDLAGDVLEIQVCYERGRPNERALTWKRGLGFAHATVDTDAGKASGPSIASPLLREGGKFGGWRVRERLGAAVASLEAGLSAFVLDKVKDYCDPPHRFRRPGRAAPDWLQRLRRRARL